MDNLIEKYQKELNNTMVAINKVKEQIAIYNKKGQELSAHANFISGKLEALKELKVYREAKKDE